MKRPRSIRGSRSEGRKTENPRSSLYRREKGPCVCKSLKGYAERRLVNIECLGRVVCKKLKSKVQRVEVAKQKDAFCVGIKSLPGPKAEGGNQNHYNREAENV